MSNKYEIPGLPKSLVEDVRKFMRGESLAPVEQVDEQTNVNEEEQLDELSPQTMARYHKKAGADKENSKRSREFWRGEVERSADQGDKDDHSETQYKRLNRNIRNRTQGMDRAISKIANEEVEIEEALKGDQHKIDMNKNGKIDKEDFKHLRATKPIKLTPGWGDGGKSMRGNYGKLATEELEDVFVVIDEEHGLGEILEMNETTARVVFAEDIVDFDLEDVMLEEVEDLTELSKETLNSYEKKAKADPAFAKKKGKPSRATVAIRTKRTKGLESAKEKLHAIMKKESEARHKMRNERHTELHNEFHKEAPKILAKHGYTKVSESDNRATYIRPHKSGHITHVTLSKNRPEHGMWAADHRMGDSSGWSGDRHKTHDTVWDDDDYDNEKKGMMAKFEAAVVKQHADPHRMRHMDEGFIEDEQNILDEARRGRPPKNAKPDEEDDDLLPRQHIMQQLERAKISMTGGAKIKFGDGSEHFVHGQHAAKVLGKYSDMKPYEKEKFQADVAQSHNHLKKHF